MKMKEYTVVHQAWNESTTFKAKNIVNLRKNVVKQYQVRGLDIHLSIYSDGILIGKLYLHGTSTPLWSVSSGNSTKYYDVNKDGTIERVR